MWKAGAKASVNLAFVTSCVITLSLEHIKHPWQRCWVRTAFTQQTRPMVLLCSISLCLSFRALETDWLLLLLLTDPATLSLQLLAEHRRSNVTSLFWLLEDAWNRRGFFICYPATNNESPQPFLSRCMCFGFALWSFLMFVHPFEQHLIVFASVGYPCFSHGHAVPLIPTSVVPRFTLFVFFLLMYRSLTNPMKAESLSDWGHLNNLAF